MSTPVNTNTAAVGATNTTVASTTIAGAEYQAMLAADPADGSTFKAASETTLAALNAKAPALSGGAVPVVQTSLPLPTGASTDATLAALSAKLITGGPQLGAGVVTATTQRVTLSTDGPEVTNSTAIKNSVAAIPAKGAATTANSTPVNIASDQVVPISASALPLPTGAATASGVAAVVTALATPAQDRTTAAAPLAIRLSDGTSFYNASGGALSTTLKGTTAAGSPTSENTDANTQSLHVKVSNSALPVTGTFFQATQPVSNASLPLPTGAATSAKQPALGTAGAAAADVITVQGVASMTPLKVDGSATTQPVSLASTTITGTVTTSDTHTTVGAPLSVRLTDGTSFYTAGGGASNLATAAKGTTASGNPTSEATDANTQSLHTKIVNASLAVTAAALPLPAGASTAAGVAAIVTALGTPAQAGGAVSVSNFPATQPVSAASLPLPTGAATQATLASVLTALGTPEQAGASKPITAAALPLPAGAATAAGVAAVVTALATPAQDRTTAAAPLAIRLSDGTSFYNASGGTISTSAKGTTAAGSPTSEATDANTQSLHTKIVNASLAVTAAALPLPAGAATAAKQPALGTVGTPSADVITVQGAASMTALKVDGSAVTQPVSNASLPLPAGASTAAKQPALGTAGSASADVLSIQGIASMVALKVDGSAVTQPVSAASLPLPTGAATQATLASVLTALGTPEQAGATKPISAAALPLPAGAATSALQTTGNTSLASLDTKHPALISGRIPVDGSGVTQPVSVASIPSPLDISGTGNLTALNQAVTLTALNSVSAGLIQLAGTWTGSIVLEGSLDNFTTVNTLSTTQPASAPSTAPLTANGFYRVLGVINYLQVRARCSAAMTGTVAVTLKVSGATGITPVLSSVAAGFLATVTTDQSTHGTSDQVAADITKVGGTAVASVSNGITTIPRVPVILAAGGVAGTVASTIVDMVGGKDWAGNAQTQKMDTDGTQAVYSPTPQGGRQNIIPTDFNGWTVSADTALTAFSTGTPPQPGVSSWWKAQFTVAAGGGLLITKNVAGRTDGARLLLSFWVRQTSGSTRGVNFYFNYIDASTGIGSPSFPNVQIPSSTAWQRVTVPLTVDIANASAMAFNIYGDAGATYALELYGVQLEQTELLSPGEYQTPTITNTTTPSLNAAPRVSVAGFGDSLLGGSAGGNIWTELARLLNGAVTFNGGVGGETSTQVSNRVVPVAWVISTAYVVGNYRSTAAGNIYKCTTAGTSSGSGVGMTGTGTGIADGTCVWDYYSASNAAQTYTRYGVVIVQGGRNNIASTATILSDIATIIGAIPHGRWVVMEILNGTAETIGTAGYGQVQALNEALAQRYGARLVRWRSLLCQGSATDTPQLNFMYDGTHPNAAGLGIEVRQIIGTMATNGFLPSTFASQFPAIGAANAAASLPVSSPNNSTILSTAGQSTLNLDLLTENVSGWFPTQGFHSANLMIIGSAGISAGAVFFEQTNDPTNASAGVPWPVEETSLANGTTIITATTIAASTTRMFGGPVTSNYVRVRNSVAFTGGTVKVAAAFSQALYQRFANGVNISQVAGNGTVNAGVGGVLSVGGNVAHSSASSAFPLRVAGRVVSTLDTTLAQGDVSDLAVTTGQQLVVKSFATSENDFQFVGTVVNTTQTAIKAAGAANIRNFVTGITYQNTNATATTLLIQDGSTTILSISCAASMANPVNLTFPTPLRGTAATALNYTAGTTAANVLLNVQGYQSF